MHRYLTLLYLLELLFINSVTAQSKNAIQGTKCAKNQVVNKLTVYEDGAIEAECGPMPCGSSAERCLDEQTSCKVETDIFSGMKWAKNGQSLLLRCCTINVPNKIYVGTDLVTLGSYYTGGVISKKDMYGKEGTEYDFVVNARTEQNGVRVWVYRIMCPIDVSQSHQQQLAQQQKNSASHHSQQSLAGKNEAYEQHRRNLLTNFKQFSENQDSPVENVAGGSIAQEETVVNPLQYRPPSQQQQQQINRQRDSPISSRLI